MGNFQGIIFGVHFPNYKSGQHILQNGQALFLQNRANHCSVLGQLVRIRGKSHNKSRQR